MRFLAEFRGLHVSAFSIRPLCVSEGRFVSSGRLALWTNDVLTSARRIYEAAGFRLASEAPHHSFGHDLVGQTWTLGLG